MDMETLLIGAALGAIPSARLGRLGTAIIAKKAGLRPAELEKYDDATDGESNAT